MSGQDVLRERIARALWDVEIDRCGVTGKRRDIAREVAPPEFYDDADAVIAALGLREERRPGATTTLNDSVWTRPDKRRYITDWEEAP